jgi:transposase
MKKPAANHPLWALKFRKEGTELRFIKGRYYLYAYKTIYDKVKQKPKKVSGQLLGSITEQEGFIASAKRSLESSANTRQISVIRCKEYGVSSLIASALALYSKNLAKVFAEDWRKIIAIAYCRFIYRCPLKSIPFRLDSSYLPQLLEFGHFNEKEASATLNRIGGQPEKMLQYMKSFVRSGDHILMDVTNVFSYSQHIPLAKKGYSNPLNFDPQYNLMYIYSADSRMPVYYKLLPGNIREVKAFKNSLLEAGLKKAIVIADKGFYSEANVVLLIEELLNFILPLRRDNALIDYTAIQTNSFKQGANYFIHEKRPVWHINKQLENGLTLHLFLDEPLRVKEENDYLLRISTHPESYSIEKYHLKKDHFGTIAMLTNLKTTDQDIYQTYKSRMAIEIMFDGMKNILDADHTYMQNEQTLQGWMFVNHITLQWYQHLYLELKAKNLLKKISVNDYIQLLTDVKKILINDKWYLNEYTNDTKKLIEKLKIKL